MPFRQKTLSAVRPKISAYDVQFRHYPEHPKTLGDKLRKYRIDHGLRQIDAAQKIGVCLITIQAWELGRYRIGPRFTERVRDFIGCPTKTAPTCLAQHLKKRRLELRLTQENVARFFGVSSGKYKYWEWGGGIKERRLPLLVKFLGYDPNSCKTPLKRRKLQNGTFSYS